MRISENGTFIEGSTYKVRSKLGCIATWDKDARQWKLRHNVSEGDVATAMDECNRTLGVLKGIDYENRAEAATRAAETRRRRKRQQKEVIAMAPVAKKWREFAEEYEMNFTPVARGNHCSECHACFWTAMPDLEEMRKRASLAVSANSSSLSSGPEESVADKKRAWGRANLEKLVWFCSHCDAYIGGE